MFIDGAYDDVQGCQLPPAPPLPHVLWAPTSNLAPQVSLYILSYHLDHFDYHDNHQCGQAPRRRRGRERLASAWISSWIQRGDFLFQWWWWWYQPWWGWWTLASYWKQFLLIMIIVLLKHLKAKVRMEEFGDSLNPSVLLLSDWWVFFFFRYRWKPSIRSCRDGKSGRYGRYISAILFSWC